MTETTTDFADYTWQQLVDYAAGRGPAQHTALVLEAQRRSIDASRSLEAVTRDLITETRSAGDCASAQTEQVIRLTNSIRLLTWVLVGVGVLQVLLMVWKG
jgi:hypothetical protein